MNNRKFANNKKIVYNMRILLNSTFLYKRYLIKSPIVRHRKRVEVTLNNKNIYRLHKKIYLNSLFAQRLQAKSLKNTHSHKIQTNY